MFEFQLVNMVEIVTGLQRKQYDAFYFRGMNLEEWVAPIPGLPCLTGWNTKLIKKTRL